MNRLDWRQADLRGGAVSRRPAGRVTVMVVPPSGPIVTDQLRSAPMDTSEPGRPCEQGQQNRWMISFSTWIQQRQRSLRSAAKEPT